MLRMFRVIPTLALLLSPALLCAQTAPLPVAKDPVAQAGPLPAAKDLVARHLAAIGGRDAILKHTSVRLEGDFEVPAAGLEGTLLIVQARDGRSAMKISVPGMGELAGGYDGTTGWSMNPMQGPRVLEGAELAQMQEDAGFQAMLRESPAIASMVTVERAALGGVTCYKVKVTYVSGRVVHDCYAEDTGLLAGTITTQETPMGALDVATLMSDWKEFGGLRVATRLRQQAMGQEQVMVINDVRFDDASDAAQFALPPAVKAIADQKKAP